MSEVYRKKKRVGKIKKAKKQKKGLGEMKQGQGVTRKKTGEK